MYILAMGAKFEDVNGYFEEVDRKALHNGTYTKHNDVGTFVPSSLFHLNSAFDELIRNNIIDSSGLILDAGCGDGRVIALTSGVYGIPSLGVEYDSGIASRAKSNFRNMKKLSVLNGEHVKIVIGDFTEDYTYSKAGVRFEDIEIVFNYIDNQEKIAAKMAKQSPDNTVFLLYSNRPEAERFAGLALEYSLELVDPGRADRVLSYIDIADAKELKLKPYTAYLHVYRK